VFDCCCGCVCVVCCVCVCVVGVVLVLGRSDELSEVLNVVWLSVFGACFRLFGVRVCL